MKFLSLKTTIFLIIILALMVVIIFREGSMRKKEDVALALVEIAAIRAGLSAYYAERGSYPKAEKIEVPGSAARLLCLARKAGEPEGFLKDGISCNGAILYQTARASRNIPFIYSSSGASYKIRFVFPASLGAFTRSGAYCATEQGILAGECE